MWKGRTIMVYDRPGGVLVKVVKVGIEDPAEALQEVLFEHPEFAALHLDVDGTIEPTAAVYSDLARGEVRVEWATRAAQ